MVAKVVKAIFYDYIFMGLEKKRPEKERPEKKPVKKS
jgi:hypothetical protein